MKRISFLTILLLAVVSCATGENRSVASGVCQQDHLNMHENNYFQKYEECKDL